MRRLANDQLIGQGGSFSSKHTEYSQSLCLNKNENYVFTLSDSYGDGLCCAHGNGWYVGMLDGVPIFYGSEFDSTVQHSFHGSTATAATGICAHMSCSTDNECCEGYSCRHRDGVNDMVCSKQDTERGKVSTGVGGAGGSRFLRMGDGTRSKG